MNDLLKRAIDFDKPADPKKVKSLIKYLGETPSLNTMQAAMDFYKAELKQILTKDLLSWMNENDQILFETEEVKVKIRTNVSAKMMFPEAGFKWLEERQYGDLITDTLAFPKGELTDEAETSLTELGLSYIKKSGIAPPSLKKIMSDRFKAGEDLPEQGDWESEADLGDGIKISYFDECIVKEK